MRDECVSRFYITLWVIEGMCYGSSGFKFSIPTPAVRPTVFPELGRVANETQQPLSAHYHPIAGVCLGE